MKIIASANIFIALVLTGCSPLVEKGWLPTERGTTSNTDRIMDLWVNSWIAALVVGIITWGLIVWCLVAYRRRKGTVPMLEELARDVTGLVDRPVARDEARGLVLKFPPRAVTWSRRGFNFVELGDLVGQRGQAHRLATWLERAPVRRTARPSSGRNHRRSC